MTRDKGEKDVLKVYQTVAGNQARGHFNQRQQLIYSDYSIMLMNRLAEIHTC